MAPSEISHRRTHNILLFSKLLNSRDNASPFTLILDTLEQPSNSLLQEYIKRANNSKNFAIFVSFETFRHPNGISHYISARKKSPHHLFEEISQAIRACKNDNDNRPRPTCLVIFDTLHPLCANTTINLPTYLSSLLVPNSTVQPSLVAVYHKDVPVATSANQTPLNAYTPNPLALLTYLATTILTLHSPTLHLSAKIASDRSVEVPAFGLDEGREGVIFGLRADLPFPDLHSTSNASVLNDSIIVGMEHRRKSGRSIYERYLLVPSPSPATGGGGGSGSSTSCSKENFALLDDHPVLGKTFSSTNETTTTTAGGASHAEQQIESTFSLSLTDKQRREREGVVLPYFDAQRLAAAATNDGDGSQTPGGDGLGGRILYDMGAEDDFDEEEDEL